MRVYTGKNQDAELHAIYRAMLTLFHGPGGQKITIFADAQVALQTITSDAPGQDSDTLSRSHNRHTSYESNEESLPNSGGSPAAGNEKADERAKIAAPLRVTALRVQQHIPGPPEARYQRAEVGRGMLMDGVALEQAPTTEEGAARPNADES